MTNLHILLVGKITCGVIDWTLAPLPQVPPLVSDSPDSSFDAAPLCSFLDHLYPTADEEAQTQELIDGRDDDAWFARGEW